MEGLRTVIKVGGRLGRGRNLGGVCEVIGQMRAQDPLLVVPGGGAFADVVRETYRQYHLSESTAHRMALAAMDQYGCLLGDLIPHGMLVSDLLSARAAVADGRVPILLPSALIIQADPLPHCWEVTSDSIAAWIAGIAGAHALILIKEVDGLFTEWPASKENAKLIQEINPTDLSNHSGGVDEYFGIILATLSLETWIINGHYPARLSELLTTGLTTGTRITPGIQRH